MQAYVTACKLIYLHMLLYATVCKPGTFWNLLLEPSSGTFWNIVDVVEGCRLATYTQKDRHTLELVELSLRS